MTKRAYLFLNLLAALLISGCATVGASRQSVSYQQYHIWISQTAAIDIEEAYVGDDEIYLKYRAFSKESDQSRVFYGRAVWGPVNQPKINLSNNIAVPLEFITANEWSEKPDTLLPLLSLDEMHWTMLRARLFQALTPQEDGQGVVVRSDQDEYFLYYDADGQMQITELKQKPVEVAIKETIGPQKLADYILNDLRRYLQDNGSDAERVVMPTFTDEYTNAFLYVDLTRKLALSLDLGKEAGVRYKESLLKKGIKSADLLIVDSYIIGILTRPVSSMARLLTWTKDAAYDVINPRKLRIMENTPIPALYEGEGMDLEKWEEELDKITGHRPTQGTMDFLIGGDEFFPRLIDRILKAEKSIDVRIFIFDNDDYAVQIADLLKRKSNEGVRVRVLLDGMGVVMGEGKIPDDLPAGFVPPDSMIKYLTKDSKVEVRVRPSTWFKADHIKTIVFDGQNGFTGGMNIGREYRYHWHDMMIELEGPIIADIDKEFNLAWEHSGTLGDIGYLKAVLFDSKAHIGEKGVPIRMLYTGLNEPQIFKAQIAAIKNAKKYIYINNAYFSDNAILHELIAARRRGVDVRVILPVNGNHEIMNQSNRVAANAMFKNGIRVFFYPGMSHIKAAVYDGWLCTGTANFDKLSFRDNLEMNLAASDEPTVKKFIDELFEPDFQRAREMTELLDVGLKEYFAEFLAEQL